MKRATISAGLLLAFGLLFFWLAWPGGASVGAQTPCVIPPSGYWNHCTARGTLIGQLIDKAGPECGIPLRGQWPLCARGISLSPNANRVTESGTHIFTFENSRYGVPATDSRVLHSPVLPAQDILNPYQNPSYVGEGRLPWALGMSADGSCRGMTWVTQYQFDGIVYVGSDRSTNPYRGDARCEESLPMLCILKIGGTAPRDYFQRNLYPSQDWAAATVGITAPVAGTSLTSLAAANQLCAETFGGQFWQMAEFHDGDYGKGGWGFWATGRLPIGTRFWVHIDDQLPGNPWGN